ncbi:MAG: hypothetical protein AUK48_08070 [Oscillatoriales cyanobacterium CG2_30_44_21]|nr:MAG: hypothetical protein AUK48_08070 [Oscillatoriales cyanobacterium CG2_30_44_21]
MYKVNLQFNSQSLHPQSLNNSSNQIVCLYRNESEFIQIVRLSQPSPTFLERSVFPTQCIQFMSPKEGMLQIYEGTIANVTCCDMIPCSHLEISDMDWLHISNNSKKDILVAIA